MTVTEGLVMVMAAFLSAESGVSAPWFDAAEAFGLGPVPAQADLRMMLTRHIARRSCALLDETVRRRREALAAGDWLRWRDAVRKAVCDGLGEMPFGKAGGPLNVRVVSRHERLEYVVENVLFESLPGLDVNASVYLPLEKQHPAPWPAIVVPVGHSTKTDACYQRPAQVFARLGYVAVTFDPPGMAGEKRAGNDHFVDGVRCYLTGHSSNRYFVIDALRCIDYLATRPDVDLSRGVGMTGVSGGGITTMFATLLDDRVKASGPSCCAVPNALHPVIDQYAPCPETLAIGRFAAYDDVDLLAAAMPTPVLLMAGANDEVFTEAMSRRIADEAAGAFRAAGHEGRFSFFLDACGHDYTAAMAIAFVRWMDRWVRGIEDRAIPPMNDNDLEQAPAEVLACGPRTDRNIFTINRDVALALRSKRPDEPVGSFIRKISNCADDPVAVPSVREGEPTLVWFHYLQELVLQSEADIELPATLLYPARASWRGPALLYFDDRGRWTDLRMQGLLTRVARFLDKERSGPAVLTVDLRGWGDTRPADVRYDIAGWGSRDRWTAYVTAAMGEPVMAMRIRDGLAALAYLRSRPDISPARIVVGGRGLGGIVALHVAAVDGKTAGAFSLDGLAAFECLAVSESYAWPADTFLSGVLQYYDIPEMASKLPMPVLIANPLDATKAALDRDAAERVYAAALGRHAGFRLRTGDSGEAVVQFVHEAAGE